MTNDPGTQEIQRLRAESDALEELLRVQEKVVVEQSLQLEEALDQRDKQIAELRLAEEQLRETSDALRIEAARSRQYLDIAGVVIVALNTNGIIELVNKKGCEVIGAPEEFVIGKNWFDQFVPELFRVEIKNKFSELISGKLDPFEYDEYLIITSHGEERLIAWHNSLRMDSTGKVVGTLSSGTDITARSRAQKELKAAHDFVTGIIDSIADPIFVKDQAHAYVAGNKAYCDLVGTPREQILGRNDYDYFPKEQVDVFWEKDDVVFQTEQENENEELLTDHRGQTSIIITKKTLYKNPETGQKFLVGAIRDVSAMKRAEKALQYSNRLLSALMSNLPGMIYRCRNDENRTIEYASKGCTDLTGYAPADLIENNHHSLRSIIHPSDQPSVFEQLERAMKRRLPFQLTYRIVTATGLERWVIEHGSIEMIPDEERECVFGIILDITDRMLQEEHRKRLMTAVEQAAESIVITSADGTIEYVNPAFTTNTGYELAESVGRNPRFLKSGKHEKEFYSQMWESLMRGEVWTGRITNRTKDGRLIEEESTISPVRDSSGRIVNYVAVRRDVTRLVELESQLRQAQKLEAVGSLAAGIAHEINTPIQFVGDNTHFLNDAFNDILSIVSHASKTCQFSCEQNSEMKKALERIDLPYLEQEIPRAINQTLEGVDRVATIVRAMKDFSHPDKGEKSNIDINSALQTTLTVARNEIKYVADVKTEFDASLPPVPCYSGELNQVFLNILVNAAHAINDVVGSSGGRGLITVKTIQSGSDVIIAITDTGAGIKPENNHRIFDPFFTTKEVGRGTGQGLAIARNVICEKHGGSITFESELGKGTTFIVRLPVNENKAVTA
jgi:PAS domain S-box-containing protein